MQFVKEGEGCKLCHFGPIRPRPQPAEQDYLSNGGLDGQQRFDSLPVSIGKLRPQFSAAKGFDRWKILLIIRIGAPAAIGVREAIRAVPHGTELWMLPTADQGKVVCQVWKLHALPC